MTIFRLVLLVSLAHALVHVFELSLPSVEQLIGQEFAVNKDTTGMLGTCWRLPFGLCAFFAGWLADRYGAKRLLIVYLVGCAFMALAASYARTIPVLFGVMLCMGLFASIYHPAGLSFISKQTTAETRGAALGWHGIFGSAGIASAPFLASVVFSRTNLSWRDYYLVLMVPALLLALLLAFLLRDDVPTTNNKHSETPPDGDAEDSTATPSPDEDETSDWQRYGLLVATGVLSGFIYSAFMHFLPRYLDSANVLPDDVEAKSARNLLTAIVLACGIGGQWLAGRLSKPGRLEGLLVFVMFANAPFLCWMAFAEGPARFWATCLLAIVHFMNQPVYNSLIAQYVASSRRSTGYGFSNLMCFGLGALGPTYAGFVGSEQWTYGGLAVVATLAAVVAIRLKAK
ncbi:MAG: MFS transporter [Dechloromonas sp.]|nr:MFS transporter [Dechloromonas sp.]